MRAEIASLQLGVTTTHVTHDQVQAMTMGDRLERVVGDDARGEVADETVSTFLRRSCELAATVWSNSRSAHRSSHSAARTTGRAG